MARLDKPCLVAGCPMLVGRGKSYCSAHDLHVPFRSKRSRPLPSGWRALRSRVLRRARYRCAICGEPAVEVDHVVSRAEGGSDDESNLQALCAFHHAEKTERERRAGIERSRRLHPRDV